MQFTTVNDSSNNLLAQQWNTKTQTPHGGQEWRDMGNRFVEDFSVTTNPLGPPKRALAAAAEAMLTVEHYPAADCEPCLSDLASFMGVEKERLICGNGASELIDLVIRMAPKNFELKWKPGPFIAQYREYARSAKNAGYEETDWSDREAALTCIVNPCNPTGDWLTVDEMKTFIESTSRPGSWVLVDESMQPWIGPHWREESLISQGEWIDQLMEEKDIAVFVIHSWTKIWACPGMRLGSMLCPTSCLATQIKARQVPWSVNSMAQAFLSACCHDSEYMEETWKVHTKWRVHLIDRLSELMPDWKFFGQSWSSWVWVDTGDFELAEKCVAKAKEAGTPIRWGKFGYNLPSFLRFGVRRPEHVHVLIEALREVATR